MVVATAVLTGAMMVGDSVRESLRALAGQRLVKSTLVVTVQSNLGVDAAIAAAGGRVLRTNVGDRYVIEGADKVLPNANVCTDVDADRFLKLFVSRIQGK